MTNLIEKALSLPLAAKLLLAFNVCALLFALTMQFGFGFSPCVLCLWQRVPYGSAAVLSLLALTWKPYRRQTTVLLGLCALAYMIGMGLAMFHTGVERHWWAGTSGCAVTPLQTGSPEDLRKALLATVAPRCDEIPWTILGLSMANLNIPLSLFLAFFTTATAIKHEED